MLHIHYVVLMAVSLFFTYCRPSRGTHRFTSIKNKITQNTKENTDSNTFCTYSLHSGCVCVTLSQENNTLTSLSQFFCQGRVRQLMLAHLNLPKLSQTDPSHKTPSTESKLQLSSTVTPKIVSNCCKTQSLLKLTLNISTFYVRSSVCYNLNNNPFSFL